LFHLKQKEKLFDTIDQFSKLTYSRSHYNLSTFLTPSKDEALTPTSTTQDDSRSLVLHSKGKGNEDAKEKIYE